MSNKYDLTCIQEYFQSWASPQETAAKINSVIVKLADWYTKTDDPCTNVYDLRECMDFLINLRGAIEEVNAINS